MLTNEIIIIIFFFQNFLKNLSARVYNFWCAQNNFPFIIFLYFV